MALKLYLTEMPRPAGGFSKHFRAALDQARVYGKPFTVKQFAEWLQQAGATNVSPASVGTSLRRFAAGGLPGAPKKPDDTHPLVVVLPGRRGKGGGGTYQYGLKRPMMGAPAKGAETPGDSFDDMDLGPAGAASTPFNAQKPAPGQDADLGLGDDDGEFSGDEPTQPDHGTQPDDTTETEPVDEPEPDGEPDDDDGEFSDEPEEGEGGDELDWIPQPDATGTYAESAMQDLDDLGYGPHNDVWHHIAKTSNGLEAHELIRKTFKINLQRKALAVAKQIFQNLGKDWDAESKRESRSPLRRLYGLNEAPDGDEDIPSPEKRGMISVGRAMPNYGMDEAQLDPVDFAQLHGVKSKRDR